MGRIEINWFTEQFVCPYVYVDNPDQNVVFSSLGLSLYRIKPFYLGQVTTVYIH